MKRDRNTAFVEKRYLLPFVLVTSLFFIWGFAHAILNVLNKHFQDVFSMDKTQSAMIQAMTYIGYFICAIPAGLFITRYGYRKGVVFGLLLYGTGALLFIPGDGLASFEYYLFSLFVIACGMVFLETAANPYVTELGAKETATSRLNLAQSFNGLGCVMAPMITGLLLFGNNGESSGSSVAIPYAVMGVVVLVIAFVFSLVKLPEIKHEVETDADGNVVSLWSHKMYILGLMALLAYEISEISINTFFINYVVEDELMTPRDASVFLSFGGLTLFMLGRFVGSAIMRFVRAEKMLFICAIGTVCTTTLVFLDLGLVSFTALCLGYAFEAIMFPTIFALSLRGLGAHTKRASSYLMMTPVGGVIGPLLMGYVADVSDSMSMAFVVPLVGYVIVLLYAHKAKKALEALF